MDLRKPIALVLTGLAATMCSAQWQSLNGGVDFFTRCFALTPDSSSLLVGGNFKYVHQDSLGAVGLANWNGASWSIDDLSPPPAASVSMPINSRYVLSVIQVQDTILTSHGGTLLNWDSTLQLAAMLTNDQWQPLGVPDGILAFFEIHGRVFGGGEAGTLFSSPMPGVREWRNGTFNPLPHSPFNQPQDIWCGTYWHDLYYFGGNTWGELGSPDIVTYDGDSIWSGVAGGMGNGWVNALVGFGDSLYVGGYFLQGGNNLSTHAQIFDGTAWHPFFPQVEFISQVLDMQVYEGALYISGLYHFVGESTWYGLLRYDGHDLCAIGGPMPSGDNGKIAFFQNNLYMALASTFPGLEFEWVGYLPLDGLIPDTCITISQASVQERERTVLRVYPNPGNDHVSISLNADQFPARITVCDMSGRRVFEHVLTSNEAINTAAWSAGAYELVLHDLRGGVLGRSSWVKLP